MGEIILLLISWVSLLLSIGMVLAGDWNQAIYFALVAIFSMVCVTVNRTGD